MVDIGTFIDKAKELDSKEIEQVRGRSGVHVYEQSRISLRRLTADLERN
jgi:hypothetical protein